MSTDFSQVFSTREHQGAIEVTASFRFDGTAADFAAVNDIFTTRLKAASQQLGEGAAADMAEQSKQNSAAMRSAISEALEKVSPEQRTLLLERYDLAAEAL